MNFLTNFKLFQGHHISNLNYDWKIKTLYLSLLQKQKENHKKRDSVIFSYSLLAYVFKICGFVTFLLSYFISHFFTACQIYFVRCLRSFELEVRSIFLHSLIPTNYVYYYQDQCRYSLIKNSFLLTKTN